MSEIPESAVAVSGLGLEVGGRVLLSGIDLAVARGEVAALMGPSGSGKTTLLHCMAGLREPTRGEVCVLGQRLSAMTSSELARFRLDNIGLVLQFGELLPELTVAENVGLPLMLRGVRHRQQAVADALSDVQLADHADAWPGSLSGGESQRAGIARAIVGRPRLIIADEPTGSVDQRLGQALIELLVGLTRQRGAGLIVATHDDNIARHADRIYRVVDQTVVMSCA